MRRNKIGVMFIVTALALAGVGITYAGWTDTITVSGQVDTGDVDMNVEYYSGTWVYKMPDHGIQRVHNVYTEAEFNTQDTHDEPSGFVELVGSAWAEPNGDDSVKIVFDNLFPCQDFEADFIVHYEGSIPARVAGSHYIDTSEVSNGPFWEQQYGGSNWMEDLWLCPDDGFGIWIEAYRAIPQYDTDGETIIGFQEGEAVDNGVQVHNCQYLWFKIFIHIPQNNAYQGCYGEFDMQLTAIQWDSFDEIDPLMPNDA